MASGSGDESDNAEGSITVVLDEGALLPWEADLAATVEGGQWDRAQLQYGLPGVTCIIYLPGTQPGVSIYRLINLWLPCIVKG